MVTVEICCGSYSDCVQAVLGGARRVELSSGLSVGGLTPSFGELKMVKESTDLEVIVMIRPRGAGFHYSNEDFEVMLEDARILLENGADGISFGCLNKNGEIDIVQTRRMIEMVRGLNEKKKIVFHRAFDCVSDPIQSMQLLIELGVDEVLTGGQQTSARRGMKLLKQLQDQFGEQIGIIAANEIDCDNVQEILTKTGVQRIHCTCRELRKDASFNGAAVSYAFHQEEEYEVVSKEEIQRLLQLVKAC